MSGLTNQAKILRGAFVEFGLSVPPLMVVFQFNPLTIKRGRSLAPQVTGTAKDKAPIQNANLLKDVSMGSLFTSLRGGQIINVSPETIDLDIRLDATDQLEKGDSVTGTFGVGPKLSTLELMTLPKNQTLLGGALDMLLPGAAKGFAFADSAQNPPVILFVWGRFRVIPVNIKQMNIVEEEFSTTLNPTRATVSVSLEVIQGPNLPYMYTEGAREVMSAVNLLNIGEMANTMVPE